MSNISTIEIKKQRQLVRVWSITFLIVFPLLMVLGYLMRLNQGGSYKISADTFYALMTLHGLGMIGVLFSVAFAILWYLIGTRFTKLNVNLGWILYFLIIAGVVGLAVASLMGKFGAGWYVLYPLPFVGAYWADWSTGLVIISLIVLGVAWLVGVVHVIYALSKEYGGFTNLLGWQYFKKEKPERELPAAVLISTIAFIPGVFSFIVAAVMLILYLLQHLEPSLWFDPLMMKNMVMFFGHNVANITLYACIGWVYLLLPEFTGRPWKVDKVVVLSWNATFFFIMFAFFHHMYMDFTQPVGFQIIGQLMSYFSPIPATAVTMFGVLGQLYHSKIKWGVIPTSFLIGTAGWAIGGFSAVVDSTIRINEVFHNTLWVPAHFHTYMLLGVVLFIFGFMFYLTSSEKDRYVGKLSKLGFWTFVTGGAGFVLMFFLSGKNSVPRRYSDYTMIEAGSVQDLGMLFARIAGWFVLVVFLGLLLMYVKLFQKLLTQKSSKDLVETA